MSADRTPMVVAAARALCRMSSDACNVDFDDNWKTYGEDFLQEARTVLDAAGASELLDALKAAVECGMVPISSAREGGACAHARQTVVADMIRDAIAKTTRATP